MPVTLLTLRRAPSPETNNLPSPSSDLNASANSADSTATLLVSPTRLNTSETLTLALPLLNISSTALNTASLRSVLRRRSAALVPSVSKPMSMRPVRESVADCLSALWIRRTASCTSLAVTSLLMRILAWASARRIMDSSCRVVAVMRRSAARTSAPRARILT